jgi:excisionase family DNA binding protein
MIDPGRPEPHVRAETVAEFLGIAPQTVYRLANRNEIPHRRYGRAIRFDLDEVVRWDRQRRRGPEA